MAGGGASSSAAKPSQQSVSTAPVQQSYFSYPTLNQLPQQAAYGQMYSPFRGNVPAAPTQGQQMAYQYGQGAGIRSISPMGMQGYQNAMQSYMQPRGIQALPMAQYQAPRPSNFYYQPQATTLAKPILTGKQKIINDAAAAEAARLAALSSSGDSGGWYGGDGGGGDGGGGGGGGE